VSIERLAAIVTVISGAVLLLFAATDNWDRIYPLPLLILALAGLAGMTALYLRERIRKRPKTMGEASAEAREARAERTERERQKAEARRTITLIRNEVAENERLARKALGRGELVRSFETENWVAHRHALAEMDAAQEACAEATAAYGLFADLEQAAGLGFPSRIDDRDLGEAINKARVALIALDDLAEIIEALRTS
jgi:hypothetical protein